MNNKGFILLDALLSVFIAGIIAFISLNVYKSYLTYKNGYQSVQEEMSDRYLEIYAGLGECEKCVIEDIDMDSLLYEPS